ncbi:hypothetical protein [Spirosoma validum]|uniref:Uncharacterized protein n=1 Tax=Spirosoma validum TaxID=2771355 RepID=A0A927B1V9_9BACT|nr:hypothetical protein [Spirosoma validum]MBD2753798.1 hypothetical protein [Spirosoma validum]
MKDFVFEFWYWLTVTLSLLFTYSYGVRWYQTMGYSKGHRVLGLLGVSGVAVCVIVLAFARDYAYVFLPLGCLGLSAWLIYNNWYNKHYPVPVGGMRSIAEPGQPDYVAQNRLLRYLANPEKHEKQKPLYLRSLRMVAIVGGALFAFGFGFSRVVYYIHQGDVRVAATIESFGKQSQQQLARVAKEVTQAVVDSTSKTVTKAVDTLRKETKSLKAEVKTNRAEAQQTAKDVKQDLRRANARLSRPASLIINQPTPRASLLPVNSPDYSDKVKPIVSPPAPKFKKKYGWYLESETESDSIIYARQYP